jgi:hypothetical protein
MALIMRWRHGASAEPGASHGREEAFAAPDGALAATPQRALTLPDPNTEVFSAGCPV